MPAERPENWKRNLAKETKNTLRDSVYSALKAMIVTGQIPPG
ncbi:GntR family transcriptional regulator, partial [Mesorhizobium sp. M7A.F.Ca.AU.002.02.1.1]